MLNYLWAIMMGAGIIIGAFTGNMEAVSSAIVSSAQEAVELCISMLGVMAMWSGILKIAEKAGLLELLSRKMQPMIRFLFPDIPGGHQVREYISTNFVANILGLGWAATPAGLKAMKELKTLNGGSRVASKEMVTFLIINISSLQLIPVNIIAYRSQYGSVNPAIIVGPAILATIISTAAGVVFIKLFVRD